ncbi:glycosyltransferase [Lysobacter sp. GX 14042]|uniref:glycosyltransferase n=1 Tax=Lysobacter sp. GX 14042 TaxID=2907155 RepID=UPI001F309B8A|nr:glycosyltransferase [Lysobacter sp. GX 14042]MCE7033031.1 glycosyltransferase [Lysobacter sp. GX 14042]
MISFVVPAWNEEALLGGTLQAIAEAAGAAGLAHEVLVVDDGSTDATAAVARKHGAIVVSVHYRQIAATRNAGARQARGAWLFFVDADTRINAPVLEAAMRALSAGAAGGGASVVLGGDAPARARRLQRVAAPLFRIAGIAGGAFLFCTRPAYEAAGGFDESRSAGEDLAFVRALRRLGHCVVLRETVTTSGRKLRTHGVLEHARLFLRFGVLGQREVRPGRERAFWYGSGRDDSSDSDPPLN